MVPCAAGHAGPREADAAPAVLRVGVGLHGEAGAQVPGLRLAAVELYREVKRGSRLEYSWAT